MSTVTTTQARRTNAVAKITAATRRAEADALEAAGAPSDIIDATWNITRAEGVASLRTLADSLERAASRVRVGARVVAA